MSKHTMPSRSGNSGQPMTATAQTSRRSFPSRSPSVSIEGLTLGPSLPVFSAHYPIWEVQTMHRRIRVSMLGVSALAATLACLATNARCPSLDSILNAADKAKLDLSATRVAQKIREAQLTEKPQDPCQRLLPRPSWYFVTPWHAACRPLLRISKQFLASTDSARSPAPQRLSAQGMDNARRFPFE